MARRRLHKRVHPYLLRHSWITEMLRQGMDVIQLSVVAAARVGVIAQHYAHRTREDAYVSVAKALGASERRRP